MHLCLITVSNSIVLNNNLVSFKALEVSDFNIGKHSISEVNNAFLMAADKDLTKNSVKAYIVRFGSSCVDFLNC